ncbi:MgtC/SapB family protein [Fervidibacillus halotolerans]|uniref:MgtC/SapB family protein n=1 Tax=Fervidibacillus halotolerans TaxID=2980027 RepID=A0A9E8LXY5_9BACI|nr:MgtC/SapB family protein [Fervidibacillus halotolerans]WAA11803.1 MgtC/SapB family protein [Fervidibacillus halotolerans]
MLAYLDMDLLLKFSLSTALGLIIGLEREMKRKPVGLKTTLVISIVSCLLTIVSIESAYKATGSESGVSITMDPLRLAAQIVSGIGFLGAGVILRRGNDTISNLTTAAIIWGAAGIGIAVGAGFYLEAIVGVILIIISVELIPTIMTFIGPKPLREKEISLEIVVTEKKEMETILDTMNEKKVSIYKFRIRDLKDGSHAIHLKVGIPYKMKTTDFYYLVCTIRGVKHVDLERLD